MIFNSLTYLSLLIISFFLYWFLNKKIQIKFIFLCSLIFYGFWRIEFIFLILFSVLIDYFIALKISESNSQKKKILLYLSISINLFLLFIFKYLNFFVENFFSFAKLLNFELDPLLFNIILPLGISFYTFQTISYTVDVYRGNTQPEKCFFTYASYVTFFPQLIAGPILRANEVIPQLKKKKKINSDDIYIGIKRIIYGLFLKVVLADNISIFVDEGFIVSPQNLSAIDIWTITFLFGFQIYFDFSAYSHIAIGSARLFGILFPENFNFPYLSNSPKEFWKKWHISLSSWIRDYLYLPLNKYKSKNNSNFGIGNEAFKSQANDKSLFITWSVMGLWHGANWTFLMWGIFHACFIFVFRRLNKLKIKLFNFYNYLGILITLPVIMLGWIPFRSESLTQTIELFRVIFNPFKYGYLNMRENTYLVCALILFSHIIIYFFINKFGNFFKNSKAIALVLELIFLIFLISTIIIYLRPVNQFIYFQF